MASAAISTASLVQEKQTVTFQLDSTSTEIVSQVGPLSSEQGPIVAGPEKAGYSQRARPPPPPLLFPLPDPRGFQLSLEDEDRRTGAAG